MMETTTRWEFPKEVHVPIDTPVRIRYTYDSDGKCLGMSAEVNDKVFEATRKNDDR